MPPVDDATTRGFWLGYHALIFVTLAGVLGALPVLLTGARPARSPRRFVASLSAGYLLAVISLGFYTYHYVPRQYTRDLDWTEPPHTSSLGDHHAYWFKKIEPWSADEKTRVTEEMEGERTDFIRTWVVVGATGFVMVFVGLAFYYRHAGSRLSAPRSPNGLERW